MMHEYTLITFLLFTKHFIIDFPLQSQWQVTNKGTYGHVAGILHAILHAIGTWFCLVWFDPTAAVWLALLDMFVHYHIDWIKMRVGKALKPSQPIFWWLLGADQYLHAVTYIMFASIISA